VINMEIVVMKFGGTSVRDESTRIHVFKHVRREVAAGYKVLVVVSAMGRAGEPYATDTLKGLIEYHSSKKETDRLLACGEIISSIVMSDLFQSNGLKSTSVSPQELGIKTDENYNNANILHVEPDRLLELFGGYDVLVAPGFIGVAPDGNITTLGRGGSDTSAIALGSALGAVFVDIYSDVEGVMTADPKLVKDARLLKKISYDNLIQLAARGAKVIHLKAIGLAKQKKVSLRLRGTMAEQIGTYVVDESVNTLSLAYQNGYSRYDLENVMQPIEHPLLSRQGGGWYASDMDVEQVEAYLADQGITFARTENYVKVTWYNQQRNPMEVTFYVEGNKLVDTINFLHYNLI